METYQEDLIYCAVTTPHTAMLRGLRKRSRKEQNPWKELRLNYGRFVVAIALNAHLKYQEIPFRNNMNMI